MKEVKSCGVIVFREEPRREFLLMKHATRWDLPKGHVDEGETDIQCAMRELQEETGITSEGITLDSSFTFENQYYVRDKRFPNEVCLKTLLIFLGWLKGEASIKITEHIGFEWFAWNPPHHIQSFTIDPLLSALERHFTAPS